MVGGRCWSLHMWTCGPRSPTAPGPAGTLGPGCQRPGVDLTEPRPAAAVADVEFSETRAGSEEDRTRLELEEGPFQSLSVFLNQFVPLFFFLVT